MVGNHTRCMDLTTHPLSLCALFFCGMVLAMVGGHRFGRRRRSREEEASQGVGAVSAAVFGLLGLLLAFTFSGAASRFDERRELITEECNDIGTAWLRLDLLPEASRAGLRDDMRRYVDSRLRTYAAFPDLGAVWAELAHTEELQAQSWKNALAACAASTDTATRTLVVSALNAVFDIAATRTAAVLQHPPGAIFALLFTLARGCAMLAGHGMAASPRLDWLHVLAFATVMVLCIYVILELEYPRFGLIRIDAFDQQLIDLRAKMG